MSRSNNSRKGKHRSRKHEKRHSHCGDGSKCDYCVNNFKHATRVQKLTGVGD